MNVSQYRIRTEGDEIPQIFISELHQLLPIKPAAALELNSEWAGVVAARNWSSDQLQLPGECRVFAHFETLHAASEWCKFYCPLL